MIIKSSSRYYSYEYIFRINGKRGCECFRTAFPEDIQSKYAELREKHPNINYTLQRLGRRIDAERYGGKVYAWDPKWDDISMNYIKSLAAEN